jgi:hypothetical protein
MWGLALSMALEDDNDGPELAQAHFWSPPEFWEFIEIMKMVDDHLLHPTADNGDLVLARKFRTSIINLMDDIFKINLTDITILYLGFARGSTWYTLMGETGESLREQVYAVCVRSKNINMN